MSEEIRRLLIREIRTRLEPLEAAPTNVETALLTAVTLRGSAGLAGETNLAAALARLESRLRANDTGAAHVTLVLLKSALARLERGDRAIAGSWPVPPADLEPTPIEQYVREPYHAELKDRLAGIDECLATTDAPLEAARIAFRHIHTLKGASGAVGDQPMSWFCQGLERRLREVSDGPSAHAALVELAKYRDVLGGLSDDPSSTLRKLRGDVDDHPRPRESPRIEPMTEADLPEAVAIMLEDPSPTDRRDPDTRRSAAVTRLKEELGRTWASVRAARIESELVGFLVTWHVADEVHVLDIATRTTARRRGIARALMNDLLAAARPLPVKHLLLEVRRGNAPAIGLYKSLGFYATSVRRRYYDDGEDGIEMRLVLDAVTREIVPTPDEFPLEAPKATPP